MGKLKLNKTKDVFKFYSKMFQKQSLLQHLSAVYVKTFTLAGGGNRGHLY